jgi:hypothetical protein
MSIREVVFRQIGKVAEQQGKVLPELHDMLPLMESGLDSLCVAIIIAELDQSLNASPFDQDDTEIPVTIGDLVRLYDRATATALTR